MLGQFARMGSIGRPSVSAAIRALFSSSEPGAWYDPSDMSTLFQDAAGTTPVTAVEQPVGRMLDKSNGLVLGDELVVNGDFTSDTIWTKGAGWAIANGKAVATSVAAFTSISQGGAALTGGKTYRIILNVSQVTAGGVFIIFSGGTSANTPAFTAAGTYTVFLTANTGNVNVLISSNASGFTGAVESISVREIPGNHATQATTTKRPVYSRRVNLLTKTEQFEDGVWFKVEYGGGTPPIVIANDASGPASDGFADKVTFSAGAGAQSILLTLAAFSLATYRSVLCLKAASPGDVGKIIAIRHAAGTAYLLITLTADYQVISRNETAPAAFGGSLDIALRPDVGTSSGEVSIHLAYASLTLATDAHLPYQRVNTATDYDADPAKFPAYLRFDGVDDAMQTGNINFTSTDKMTVWAGVTKLSDAAAGILLESSVNVSSNSGAFYITAPEMPGVSSFAFRSRGSLFTMPVNLYGNAAPISRVVAAIGDIGGDISTIRAGGASATNAEDQGTGNYGNYPLYVGARAGTLYFFNGRLYSLIVRGAQTNLSQIEAAERYIKQKMRMP